MQTTELTLPTEQFEVACKQMISVVKENGTTVTITEQGTPIARLVPAKPNYPLSRILTFAEFYGSMKGMATITGDIKAPLDEDWEADR